MEEKVAQSGGRIFMDLLYFTLLSAARTCKISECKRMRGKSRFIDWHSWPCIVKEGSVVLIYDPKKSIVINPLIVTVSTLIIQTIDKSIDES